MGYLCKTLAAIVRQPSFMSEAARSSAAFRSRWVAIKDRFAIESCFLRPRVSTGEAHSTFDESDRKQNEPEMAERGRTAEPSRIMLLGEVWEWAEVVAVRRRGRAGRAGRGRARARPGGAGRARQWRHKCASEPVASAAVGVLGSWGVPSSVEECAGARGRAVGARGRVRGLQGRGA